MHIKLIAQFVFCTIVAGIMHGCRGYINPVYPPPRGIYFAFPDEAKTAIIKTENLLIERVDLKDSTKIVKSHRMLFPVNFQLYDNRDYKFMFQFKKSDSLFVQGWNKLRLVYSGKTGVDWLEFYSQPEEWVNPEQVKFNGKPISRLEVDQPTPPSYLYVLK